MAKHAGPLKLPDDFIGTVRALLQAPPPPKRQAAKRKKAKAGTARKKGEKKR